MAYTTIDDPKQYFEAITYSGDGNSTQNITANFQVDWSWIKHRGTTAAHTIQDSVRGFDLAKKLSSNENDQENDSGGATWENYGGVTAATATNFTVSRGSNTPYQTNASSANYVAWNWLAGGSAPAITYSVKVVSDSGNKYRFDDFGTSAVTLDLQEGGTYTFDQSDSSNSGHPLRFYTASDKSGGEYTTGVTTTGTAGSSGAKTVITVAASAPTLYYQCSNHAGMGGQANTNSTFGSSNFAGSIQSTVSASTTSGFSIVSYTGTGSAATFGHGLSSAPKVLIVKRRDSAVDWSVFHPGLGSNNYRIRLNSTDSYNDDTAYWNGTAPTSSVFSVGTDSSTNASSGTYVCYAFAEKKGYSKFGSYTGNGSTDGTFVYTGFKPALIIIKNTTSGHNWLMFDNKRDIDNPLSQLLMPNQNSAEQTMGTSNPLFDFCSNGFKLRGSGTDGNESGSTHIYMAFAESPFVNTNGIPTNAR